MDRPATVATATHIGGTQAIIDRTLRSPAYRGWRALATFFTADPANPAVAMSLFNSLSGGSGALSTDGFAQFLFNLGPTFSLEDAAFMAGEIDRRNEGLVQWGAFVAEVELAKRREDIVVNRRAGRADTPAEIKLYGPRWRDPNAGHAAYRSAAVDFKGASLKAHQVPVEEVDVVYLQQFASLMSSEGVVATRHVITGVGGPANGGGAAAFRIGALQTRVRVKLTDSIDFITWRLEKPTFFQRLTPGATKEYGMPVTAVVELVRGPFPGSVAMPLSAAKRCVSVLTETQRLNLEATCEEDADLLFAGLAMVTIGQVQVKKPSLQPPPAPAPSGPRRKKSSSGGKRKKKHKSRKHREEADQPH